MNKYTKLTQCRFAIFELVTMNTAFRFWISSCVRWLFRFECDFSWAYVQKARDTVGGFIWTKNASGSATGSDEIGFSRDSGWNQNHCKFQGGEDVMDFKNSFLFRMWRNQFFFVSFACITFWRSNHAIFNVFTHVIRDKERENPPNMKRMGLFGRWTTVTR